MEIIEVNTLTDFVDKSGGDLDDPDFNNSHVDILLPNLDSSH